MRTSKNRMRRLGALGVAAAIAAGVSLGTTASQAQTTSPRTASRPHASRSYGYLDRIDRVARSQRNYGSLDLQRKPYTIRVFTVGPPSAQLRQVAESAPPKIRVLLRRCAYTNRRLVHAQGRVMRHLSVNASGQLRRAGGLVVWTTSRKLIHALRPDRLLGVHVAVLVRYAQPVTPS